MLPLNEQFNYLRGLGSKSRPYWIDWRHERGIAKITIVDVFQSSCVTPSQQSRRHQCSKTLSSCWMFVFTAHFFSSLLLWFTMQTVCGTFLQPIEEAQKKSRVYSETEMAVCLRSTDCSSADWLGPSLSGYLHCDQNRFAYNLFLWKL